MIGFYNYTVWLTYVGLLCGVTGIGFAANGNTNVAVILLLIGGLCDMFDGAVARSKKDRTEDEKKFGAEIDSLTDICVCGILPSVIVGSLFDFKWYIFPVLGLYVLAGLIRLGYYGVLESKEHHDYFVGLPITFITLVMPGIYLTNFIGNGVGKWVCLGGLCLCGFMFVSKFKFKKTGKLFKILATIYGCAITVLTILLIFN